MTTLTKARIADAVAESIGFDRTQSIQLIDRLLDIIKDRLIAGEDLLISGFGKFEVRDKKARLGRNPATGEPMTLPDHRVIVFRCSTKMRERINDRTV
jgi:integration host factor subunit alpha